MKTRGEGGVSGFGGLVSTAHRTGACQGGTAQEHLLRVWTCDTPSRLREAISSFVHHYTTIATTRERGM